MTQVNFSGGRCLSHSKGEPERTHCGSWEEGNGQIREWAKQRMSQTDGGDTLQSYLEVFECHR